MLLRSSVHFSQLIFDVRKTKKKNPHFYEMWEIELDNIGVQESELMPTFLTLCLFWKQQQLIFATVQVCWYRLLWQQDAQATRFHSRQKKFKKEIFPLMFIAEKLSTYLTLSISRVTIDFSSPFSQLWSFALTTAE